MEPFVGAEGLAHYVWEHAVRLPGLFVSQVRLSPQPLRDAPRPKGGELGQRDRSWPGAEFAHRLWTPPRPFEESDGLPHFDPYPTWWLEQGAKIDN
jgi:hypothetical protein